MKTIIEKFKEKYGYLEKYGMTIIGVFREDAEPPKDEGISVSVGEEVQDLYELKPNETCRMSVGHPFVFDSRLLPDEFEGVRIRNIILGDWPEEFDVDPNDNFIPIDVYSAPEKYVRFVERCFDEIRLKLDNPKMTKEEMLDALSYNGDFSKHVSDMEELRIKRIIGN